MNRSEFGQRVQRALAHLHDYAYLDGDDLVGVLVKGEERPASMALSRHLTEAIERLRPPGELPEDTMPWRKYLCLVGRFVQHRSVAQVARELGLGERQALRIQSEAVDDVAAALWATTEGESWADQPASGSPETSRSNGDEFLVNTGEVARIVAASEAQTAAIGEVIAGVLETAHNLLASRGATASTVLPTDLPLIAVERSLLRQSLLNLLIAALDTGGTSLTFTAQAGSGAVDLRLLAEGFKYADDTQAQVFAERLRHDRSLKMSRQLIQLQGGDASLEATAAGGVVARLVLPFVRSRRVLVIDDNPDTLRLFGRYLEGEGYRTLLAQDSGEGLRLALEEQPDAIVLDVMMPAQDGWEVLQILRHRVETEHVPVIICSVIAQRDLALSLGANDLLAKPVNLPDLGEALLRCWAC